MLLRLESVEVTAKRQTLDFWASRPEASAGTVAGVLGFLRGRDSDPPEAPRLEISVSF